MRTPFFTSVVALSLVACSLVACKQSEGDPCQSARDCDDGLVCTVDDIEASRGFCQKPKDVDEMQPASDGGDSDLAPDPDGAIDAGSDAGDASTGPDEDAG